MSDIRKDILQTLKKRPQPTAASNVCKDCNMTFTRLNNLIRHRRNTHGLSEDDADKLAKKGLRCSECAESFSRYSQIEYHYKTTHKDIHLCEEIFHFTSIEGFNSWKENIERATLSKFVAARGYGKKKNTENCSTQYLCCHRSGIYVPKGCGKRGLKSGGSNKIGKFCPARMTVVRNGQNVKVKFNSTHLGHNAEFDRLPLSRSERKYIARQMAYQFTCNCHDNTSTCYGSNVCEVVIKEGNAMHADILDIITPEPIRPKNSELNQIDVDKSEAEVMLSSISTLLEACSTQAEVDAITEMLSKIEPRVLAIQSDHSEENSST